MINPGSKGFAMDAAQPADLPGIFPGISRGVVTVSLEFPGIRKGFFPGSKMWIGSHPILPGNFPGRIRKCVF